MDSILLCRISDLKQNDGYSLDAQERFGKEYCTKNNFDLKKLFRLVETGSKSHKREKFDKMMDYIREYVSLSKTKVLHLKIGTFSSILFARILLSITYKNYKADLVTNLFTVCVLILLTVTANAADDMDKCADYLRGLANPDIIRFGGSNPRTPIQDMANLMLAHVPSDSPEQVQIAMPVFLTVNQHQPQQFGDGQQNALAAFGSLPRTPTTAILKRATKSSDSSELTLILSRDLPDHSSIRAVEISILGKFQKVSIDSNGMVQIPVNLQELAWDQMVGTKPMFFRPMGWRDWFAVQFAYPYLPIEDLIKGMAPIYRSLPNGKSVIDPLGVKGSTDVQNDLRQIDDSHNQGFALARAEQVHGTYWLTDENGPKVLTSNGGVWTRYRLPDTTSFKNVYLAKDPRIGEIETRDGVVSGTGPHYIGATGEIIVNSLGQNNLMTFYGVQAPNVGPDGNPLAWGFTHQWIGTWLKPGQAFVTPQGLFHWHLNHLPHPIAAQVFTPPEVPSNQNHFGFPPR